MAREDERRAEEGLVELLEDGELSCKRLEALAPRDLPARLEAEDARTSWLVERAKERAAERLGDARDGQASRERVLVGGRPGEEPVREGDDDGARPSDNRSPRTGGATANHAERWPN